MNCANHSLTRRSFCKSGLPAIAGLIVGGSVNRLFSQQNSTVSLKTRGVVLTVDDLLTLDWALLAHEANLTTIGTHVRPSQVSQYIQSDKGQHFLSECKKYNIEVEHELHAMHDLLPRNLFEKNPEIFRMNKEGTRVADYNCCPNSQAALQVIGENAVKYSDILRSTTGRYFYWIDDGRPMCSCDRCKNFSDSEQALLIENAIVKALRKSHPRASVAHLAYINTMRPPVQVKPEEGVFLEFAPIYRSWRKPLTDRNATADVNKEGDGSLLTHG